MVNVLTDLAGDMYKAADMIGREVVGITNGATINADGSERVAVGGVVRSHFTRAATVVTSTPSMTIPEGTDQTVDNKTLTLTKERSIQVPWTGEDVKFVNNGSGWSTVYGDQIVQGMRSLANEIEVDLGVEAYQNASRAFGAEGTAPFGTNFDSVAEIRKILVDNGMPIGDGRTSLAINTAAGTNLRQLVTLTGVDTSGNDTLLRQGELLPFQGISIRESAQIAAHTQGTSSGHLVDDASLSIGDTLITVDTGTGTIVAGDTVTFAGDTNEYVVVTALAALVFTIAEPGLRLDIADSAAITVGDDYDANVAWHQSALELAMRAPALPEGGDLAVDRLTVQDPWSGLVFEIAAYKGYRKAMFDISATWGVKAWKPEHIAILFG